MNENITAAIWLKLDNCPLCEISSSTGLGYKIIKQLPYNENMTALVQVAQNKHADSALFPHERVLEATLVHRTYDEILLKLVLRCGNCFFTSLAGDLGTLAGDLSYADGGAVAVFWLQGKEEFKKLLNYFEVKGLEFKILQVTRKDKLNSELTPKQVEILKYAFENGYFEKYRKTSLREIADHFELGVSTTCIHLRTATKKVVKNFLPLGP